MCSRTAGRRGSGFRRSDTGIDPATPTLLRDAVSQASLPRAVFGAGALRHLPREVDALGLRRLLVLSMPGQRASDLDRAVDLAMQGQYSNPRPLQRGLVRELPQRAFDGTRPD